MLQNLKDEFCKKYDMVFDSEGNIKACGRQTCRELIEFCEKIKPVSANTYGDVRTGVMNVSAIKILAFDILNHNVVG